VPFELRVAPGEFLAHVRGWGREDFGSTAEAMRTLGRDPRLAAGMPVLFDARELDYLATPPEVAAFATPESLSALFAGRRVALLTRRGAQFGVGRTFAAKAEMSGSEVEIFVEPDLALAWLAGQR
jgi:hypothetical protein